MQKKSSRVDPVRRPLAAQHRSTPWHAVSVVPGKWCCEPARGLACIRHLSREAPRLPLPQCSAPEACSCAYKHHADRRGQPRRKDDISGLRRPPTGPNDRRVSRGRREDD